MPTRTAQVFQRLLATFGPQGWWPGDSPFEIMVGAVLVQNTAWKNVEPALDKLRNANLLDPLRLAELSEQELQRQIHSSGAYRVKAKRLRALVDFVVKQYDGSIPAMRRQPTQQLKHQLLGVHGIGPETADSILLYALGKPVLVVDAYTKRIWARHGWISYDADYHRLQQRLADELPADAGIFNEMHALLVALGGRFCRKQPACEHCPLVDLLPPTGLVLPEVLE